MGLFDGLFGLVKETVSDPDKLGNTIKDGVDIYKDVKGGNKPSLGGNNSSTGNVQHGSVQNLPSWAPMLFVGLIVLALMKK